MSRFHSIVRLRQRRVEVGTGCLARNRPRAIVQQRSRAKTDDLVASSATVVCLNETRRDGRLRAARAVLIARMFVCGAAAVVQESAMGTQLSVGAAKQRPPKPTVDATSTP